MKRIISIAAAFLVIFSLASCSGGGSESTPMTANQFKSSMEEKGLSVVDQTDSVDADSSYQDIVVATDGDKYSIEYYAMTDVESAKNVYSYATNNLDSNYKDDSSAVILANSTEDSGRYEVTASDYYCVVWQNKNVVVYLTSSVDYKDEVRSILSEIGY